MRSPTFGHDIDREIEEARLIGIVAGHHRPLARSVEHDRDVRIEVGQQQDAGGAVADLGDAADQPLAGHRRLAARDAVAPPALDQHVAREGAAGIGDDLRREEARRAFRHYISCRPRSSAFSSSSRRATSCHCSSRAFSSRRRSFSR